MERAFRAATSTKAKACCHVAILSSHMRRGLFSGFVPVSLGTSCLGNCLWRGRSLSPVGGLNANIDQLVETLQTAALTKQRL